MTPATAPPIGQASNESVEIGAVADTSMNVSPPTLNGVPNPSENQMQFTAAEQLEIDRFLGEYGNDPKAVSSLSSTVNYRKIRT